MPREAEEHKNKIKNLSWPQRVGNAQGTPHLDHECGAYSMCWQGEDAGLGH